MVFEDLELRLKKVLSEINPQPKASFKVLLRAQALKSYQDKSQPYTWLKYRRYFAQVLSVSAMSAFVLSAIGFLNFPMLSNRVVGEIRSEGGVVEIIRGDESLLVSGTQDLRQGDWVRVGHRGRAYITTDYFESEVAPSSRLKMERSSRVFLEKGRVSNTASQATQIKTVRGLIKNGLGSEVAVEVSETGETKVLPGSLNVLIYDSNNGQTLARAGEQVVLRSDTLLTDLAVSPTDLELSKAQIESILGILVIARTKALTGIESMSLGKRSRAHKEITSAEQSFRSVVQILDNGRNMTLSRRVNLEAVSVDAVYPALALKTDRLDLLTEAYALEQLFAVLEQNKNSLAFAPVNTEVTAFNRYVLLHYLASVATPEQAMALNTLADNYVVSMLRKVQQSPIRMEQLAYLNQQVNALPRNDEAQKFLLSLKSHLSPDLANALNEKLSALF